MKFSIYNSLIKLTQKSSLLYNAVEDKFLVFKKELEPLLVGNADDIATTSPSFYNLLLNNNFLVENCKQEVEDIVARGRENCNNDSTYNLIINPTLNCNFRCWYCYENHDASMKMDVITIKKIQRLIDNIVADDTIKCLHLSFFGGEPLLFYTDTVRPIIDYVQKICCDRNGEKEFTIHFTSNGYLINDSVITHLMSANALSVSFQITLDGGRDMHNKVRYSTSGTGSYDRIVKNIKKLLSYSFDVVLRINYTMQNIASVPSILKDLEDISDNYKHHLSIDFQRVWQDEEIESDDEMLNDVITRFSQKSFHVSSYYNHINSFRHPCYGDKENECVVNYNGDIYKCTARDFTESNRLGILSDDGKIIIDKNQKHACASKFDKVFCHTCRIFPICGGCCTQRARESQKDACTNGNNEYDKDKIILMRFYDCIRKQKDNDMLHAE